MRKSFTTKIAVLLVLFVLAGGAMFAEAVDEASIDVNGVVAIDSDLTIVDNEETLTIVPDTGVATPVTIGTASYYSNAYAGFNITVYADNGALVDQAEGRSSNTIPYAVTTSDVAKFDIADFTNVAPKTLVTSSVPVFVSTDFTIQVSVPAPEANTLYKTGTYKDTLRFTLTNN